MGCYFSNGIPVAWFTTKDPRYGKQAYASDCTLSMGSSAGVATPFVFTNVMTTAHRAGYGASTGALALVRSTVTTLRFDCRTVSLRREEGKQDWKMEGKTEQEVAEMGDISPRFRYVV
jgi:hypothetical protein